MPYTEINFASKKALKEAVAAGKRIGVFQYNNLFGKTFEPGETVYLEGPHYPKPHKWYAQAVLGADCCIDKVK